VHGALQAKPATPTRSLRDVHPASSRQRRVEQTASRQAQNSDEGDTVIRESISFAKLNDETWGIRVATKAKRHPSPGDEVIVTKRNGQQQRIRLGAIVSQDRGAFPGPAVYYRIAR
jgi:hypothetical protein